MLNEATKLLNSLKQSADQPDVYHEGIIRRIVISLPDEIAFQLAFQQASSYLLIFENIHPTIGWPREYLEIARKLQAIDYDKHSFGFYDEEVTDSPSKSFINALGYINGALRAWVIGKRELQFGLSLAITSVYYAKMAHYWMQYDPESWNIKNASAITEDEIKKLKDFKHSSKWSNMIQDLVTSLAEEIAEIISENSRPLD